MKAKKHLNRVTELGFNSIPPEVEDILLSELGYNKNDGFVWLGVLNGIYPYKSKEDFSNFIFEIYGPKASSQKRIDKFWPVIKLILDMVKTGILDKYRG